jgi:chain length determinant protein EpsF
MSLQQLIIIFWVRKGLIIAYLLATMITTLTLSLMMPKQYVASTSLVLDQPGINPITGATLPIQLTTGYMATQTDIIKSPTVALYVIDILGLMKDKELQSSFKKGNKLKAEEQAAFQAVFEEGNEKLKDDGKQGVLKRKLVNDFRNSIADDLMKKLEVLPSRESSILGISFSATDPEFSAKAANAYAQAYIQTANELKRQPAKQTADWFDGQLNMLRERMEKAREELSDFQQTHGIVATTNEQIDLEDAKLTELSSQLVKNQLETADLLSKKKLLTENLNNPEALKSLNEVLSSPVLQELKAGLAQSESKFADLAIHVDKNHPQYQQAAAAIANLKKQIKTEMNTILHGFNSSIEASKNRDESLSKALAKQKTRVLALKNDYNKIALLKREAENAQVAYDAVNQRSIQMRMESEIRQSNVAVLDQAVAPKVASKPKVTLNMILSILLGSILGVAAALFAEMMDRRVRSPADIEGLDLPVFGVIAATQPSKKFNRLFGERS